MELYEKLLPEEIFVDQMRVCGVLHPEDIAGKKILIVCAIGGIGLLRKIYAESLGICLMQMDAARCERMLLFNADDSDSYYDLTDVSRAVGTGLYDFVIVLGGMEKTRRICEGVRQLQEACRAGGKIFVAARTAKDISARHTMDAYEDLWRYDIDDLTALFGGCALEASAKSGNGEIIGALLVRGAGAAASGCRSLLYVRNGNRIDPQEELPQGYFDNGSDLDAIGVRCRTDKCSMNHNYLDKYAFFLERFCARQVRLLELGIHKGASLRMWQEYLPYAEIFGVDVRDDCHQYETARIHTIRADLSKVEEVSRLKEIRPQIIVDDASHIVSHQLLALFTLFDVLPSGGVYILEDVETSLNPEQFEDGYRDAPLDAYEVCSRIARIAARKVPDDDSVYAEQINRIGMAAEMVSIMKGSVVFIK